MPNKPLSTRNQLERLMAIHDKLSTGLHYSFRDLLNACQERTGQRPSDKTLYNDLRWLREEYDAPISEHVRSEKPYFYTRPGFSLYAVLNPQDAALANEAAALLKQVAHLPQFEGLDDVFVKFEQRAGVVGKAQDEVVQWEHNPRYTGTDWLKPLYDLIRADQPARLTYTEFDRDPVTYTFSPYLLKEYNNRWHIYGWAAERDCLLNLPLDRIDKLKPLPDLRRRPCDVDWATYLTDVVGFTLTNGESLCEYRVRVWFPRAHYLLTKPLHHTQDIGQRTSEFVDFVYHLRWNLEFDAALLALGPDAELLEPADKRAAFARKVRALAERYTP